MFARRRLKDYANHFLTSLFIINILFHYQHHECEDTVVEKDLHKKTIKKKETTFSTVACSLAQNLE